MQFQIKRDVLIRSLSIAHSIIERKNTLPILYFFLLEIKNNKLNVVATDLDIIFFDEISDFKSEKEGSTTTSATVLYDILKKLPSNSDVLFTLQDRINLISLLRIQNLTFFVCLWIIFQTLMKLSTQML